MITLTQSNFKIKQDGGFVSRQVYRKTSGGMVPLWGGAGASLQPLFVSWLESNNPTTCQATGNAIGGTATLTSSANGALSGYWSNGTLSGLQVPTMQECSLFLVVERVNTGDGITTWLAGATVTNFRHRTFNAGAVGGLDFAGTGITFSSRMDHLCVCFVRNGSDIKEYVDGDFIRDLTGVGAGGVNASAITSTLPVSSRLYLLGIANHALSAAEVSEIYNSGNFKLWADL